MCVGGWVFFTYDSVVTSNQEVLGDTAQSSDQLCSKQVRKGQNRSAI